MKQKYLVINIALCHDCNNCFIACKDEHVGNSWLPYTDEQPRHGPRWMNIKRKERGQYPRIDCGFLPMPCQHCQDPPCAKNAPEAVTVREDGVVLIDPVKAKGNKAIVDSCPYGAIYWNEEKEVPQKCTFCAHILDGKGDSALKQPRCAHSCPTGAISYYEMDAAEFEKKAAAENLECYEAEPGMKGNIYYQNLHRFTKNFIAGGILKNGDCAEGDKVTLKGADVPEQTTNCFGDFKFDGLLPGTYTVAVNGNDVKTVTIDASLNIGSIEI
jgi:Fe-S-cluster-containing dehydrogenase component